MKCLGIACLLFAVFLCNAGISDGYKILGVFPTMAKSHYITGSALMKGLAAAGHEVTVISPFPQAKPVKNFRDLKVLGIVEKMKGIFTKILDLNEKSIIQLTTDKLAIGNLITNFTLTHDVVQKFLRDPNEKFDVIIVEVFMNDAMYGFGQHFNAPVIGFSSFGASKWTADLVGTPSPLSYVPNTFLAFTHHMTFVQRIGNTLMSALDEISYHFFLSTQSKIYEDSFPGNNKPELVKLRKNVSLVLLNSHFTMSFPRPYVPNMIEIGGIHINRDAPKELPQDIKQFIESAEHGVVYFSMGSNIQSSQLPVEIRDGLLKAFSKLKQRVLWKWEDTNLPGKPDNVLINKWFPQDDVLAHPNIRLFITHGGLLSSTEAVYHGVPIIGIPVFGDQSLNMAKAVLNGYGLLVEYKNLTETSISWALKEMLENDKYSSNAKTISARYRDQPLTPMETGVYWVEYVARHKGAPHMHSAGQDLPWIVYHNLDVYAFLLAATYFVLSSIKMLLSAVWKKLFKSSSSPSVDKKKKRN